MVKRFPDKIFGYSELDWPLRLLRGVYPGMRKSVLNLNRFRSSSYLTFYSDWRNPFVSAFTSESKPKDLLFSFMGRTSRVRRRLFELRFEREDVVIEDTSSFQNWSKDDARREETQRRYADLMARSRFVLCPAGAGPSTIRLFEAMEMAVVPVVISDDWMRPIGPDWSSFAVIVPEDQMEQLPALLESYGDRWQSMAASARRNWEEWFSPAKQFNFIIDSLELIRRTSLVSEQFMIKWVWPLMVFRKKYVRPRSWMSALRSQFHQPVAHSS
jgi:hypothetical protein